MKTTKIITLYIIVFPMLMFSSNSFSTILGKETMPPRISKEPNGMSPYLPNYIGYNTNHSNANNEGELKFQISVKQEIIIDTNWFFAYTQKSFWSIQESSEPFRENNLSPETFWQYKAKNIAWMPSVQLGIFRHESTGEAGLGSHGWDTTYIEPTFLWKDLYIVARAWVPAFIHSFDIKKAAPDNTDILKYYGNGEVTFIYGVGMPSMHSLKLGYAPLDDSVAWEYQADISWKKMAVWWNKLTGWKYRPNWNPHYFVQWRSGYGEGLKTYNRKTSSFVIGVNFVR